MSLFTPFKKVTTLKSHMRKKKHYKINPLEQTFDRYYIINYAKEPGEKWADAKLHSVADSDDSENDPEWDGKNSTKTVVCLFWDR